MARGKKKLMPEEKLERAIVSVEERPYSIPENWCWTKAKFISEIYSGNSINEKVKSEKYTGQTDGLIFIATKDIGFNNEINYETNVRISDFINFKVAPANTALLCIEGGSAGRKVGFVTQDVCFGNKLCAFVTKTINSKFIYYVLQSKCFIDQFNSKKHGLIGGVSVKDLAEIDFMIPPFAEQQRIVDRIESLFAKLDKAKKKAQAVVDGIELRRSVILHKAFIGELTQQWRQVHGIELDSWKRLSIDYICNSLKYGTAKKSEKSGSVVVIRMGNLQGGEIDWSDLVYSNDKDDIERYHLDVGDVLFNRTNSAALVGKTSIYRGEYPAIYAGYLIKLDYNHNMITGDFLNYALNTDDAKKYCNFVKTDGVNQSNINAKKIGAYIIPVPTIDEQVEIVAILQRLFVMEKQAKEAAESVIDQINIVKKSILARAFRGELGTNDPTEESAKELLLKTFKTEKVSTTHRTKPTTKEKKNTEISYTFASSLEKSVYQFILDHPECALSEMKNLSENFADINKVLLTLKQKKKIQISNSKYRVII